MFLVNPKWFLKLQCEWKPYALAFEAVTWWILRCSSELSLKDSCVGGLFQLQPWSEATVNPMLGIWFFSMKNFTTLVLISRYLMHLWMHFWYCVRVQLHPYVCGHVGSPEAHVEKGIISSSGNPRWPWRNFTHGFMSGISILFHLLTCQSLDQSHTSLAVVVL